MRTPSGREPTPRPSTPTKLARVPGTTDPASEPPAEPTDRSGALSRRGFLRAAAVTGGGLVTLGVAACAPSTPTPGWTLGPTAPAESPAAPSAPPSASPDMSQSPAPSGSAAPDYEMHDAKALEVVKRYLDGEWQMEGIGNEPKAPKVVDGVKVFELTIDDIEHRIDAVKDPLKALGFDGTWPGPRLDVIEGDTVRAIFTNRMSETTGIHFHGQRVPNAMDGVPHVTQDPIKPGDSFTYEFVARTTGSHMYHSHHNATDQVGRGLLGAFIVAPKDPAQRYDARYGVTQDIVWISNDTLGGFTINGRGFPATVPIVANLGEKILIRFMNEGVMMHPWHLHGMPMRVVARDGYELGSAAFTCDTLGVNPGERWDVIVDCDEPGVWAYHCHILPHVEGQDGMFGMVTALIVNAPATAARLDALGASPVVTAAAAAGSTATLCRIPGLG